MDKKQKQLLETAKRIDKINAFSSNSILATINEFDFLDKRIADISDKVDGIAEELKKKLESELELEINKEELKGDKGDSYILTKQDKKEIAGMIEPLPPIEKVIEKRTETIIKEQPIVTEITKETKVENPFILNGEEIVEKINDLEVTPDLQIDAKHIKNLPKEVTKIVGGGTNGIVEIIAGTGITVDKSNLKYPIISSTGGNFVSSTTTRNLTVSTSAPSNPQIFDLWYDIS